MGKTRIEAYLVDLDSKYAGFYKNKNATGIKMQFIVKEPKEVRTKTKVPNAIGRCRQQLQREVETRE